VSPRKRMRGLQQVGPLSPPALPGCCKNSTAPVLPPLLPSHPHRRPCYCLFAAFDGHNGTEAARFAAHTIVPILEALLPPREAPGASSAFPSHHGPGQLQGQLQAALVETLLELQRQFAMAGLLGGCTATLVLQVGGLRALGLGGEPGGRSSRQWKLLGYQACEHCWSETC
jgi:hypothetical protein